MLTQSTPAGVVRVSPRRNREEMICRQCPEMPLRVQCPHSEEGRQYLAQLELRKKKIKAPQRCSKCPNRPLRSQCEHTATGRTFLLQQQIQAAVTGPTGAATPPSLSTPTGRRIPSTMGIPTFAVSQVLQHPTTPLANAAPWTESHVFHPATLTLDPLLLVPQLGDTATVPSSSPGPSYAPPPDAPVLGTPASTHSTSSDMTPSSQSLSTPSTPSKGFRKHERATKGNPFHGFVKGSMRGPQDHAIFRRHKRPDPLIDSKEASKAFLDKMNRLVERAEDISVLTGCWLFIGAQHPGGAGATIHYTSPRLLRDAPDHAADIVNDYHQLMSNLLQARRLEALNISQKYQASLVENQAMASRVADLESQMMTMQQSIALYQSRLGLNPQGHSDSQDQPPEPNPNLSIS